MSLNSALLHDEDPGYAADLENSLEPRRSSQKLYRHHRLSTSSTRSVDQDSSSDSDPGESLESGVALSRCSSPSADSCIECHRSMDRCRCRSKCRGRPSPYNLWKQNLSRSFDVQFNSVELPEAISGNYTPSLWHSDIQRRFNHMFHPQSVQVHQQQNVQPVQYQVQGPQPGSVSYYVGWPVQQYGYLQQVGWVQVQQPQAQQGFQLVYPYQPIVHN